MPRQEIVDYNDLPGTKNWNVIGKKVIYSAAIGTAASVLLGGESFSQSQEFIGMNLPQPISAGLGICAGTLTANVLDGWVLNTLFDNMGGVRQLESSIVKGGLAAGGSVAGLYWGSGISPSLNGALLGLGSYVGAEYAFSDLDQMLLGRLF